MNRRRFLQFTVALAVAAPLAHRFLLAPGVMPDLLPERWIPTNAQVAEWLEYYKLYVRAGCEKFADVVKAAFAGEPMDLQQVADEFEFFDAAERAFMQLNGDRSAVGGSQGLGYDAGRGGLPRFSQAFTGPSNAGFAWYNGWAVGHFDRTRKRLDA